MILETIAEATRKRVAAEKEKCSLAEMKEKATAMNPDTGFPFEKTTKIVGKAGDCVIPVNHVENVKKLHEMLFANETYTPSKTVVGIGNQIINDTGIQ